MNIISPLVYCELRSEQGDPCDTVASLIVEGLPCCERCGNKLLKALADEGITLITRLDSLDKKDGM